MKRKRIIGGSFLFVVIVSTYLRFFANPVKYTLPFPEVASEMSTKNIESMILPSHIKPLLHRQETDEELVEMILSIEDKRFFQHF